MKAGVHQDVHAGEVCLTIMATEMEVNCETWGGFSSWSWKNECSVGARKGIWNPLSSLILFGKQARFV